MKEKNWNRSMLQKVLKLWSLICLITYLLCSSMYCIADTLFQLYLKISGSALSWDIVLHPCTSDDL